MEGISGIDRLAMTKCEFAADYAAGQEYLVDDVNAVVEGLVAAGVSTIEVIDRHGSGCDDIPDLPTTRLHPKARMVDEKSQPLFERTKQRQWDAVVLVGAHTGPGRNGFLEHVGSFGIERILNGVSISESDQSALINGLFGIPIIFASGDDRLREQFSERMPWVAFVEVKRATSRSSAVPLAPARVRAALFDSARAAVQRRNAAKTVELVPPLTGAYKPVWPLTLEPLSALPGYDISEGLVRVTGANLGALNMAINRISVLVAGAHTANAFWEAASRNKELDRFRDSLFMAQWLEGPPSKKPVP